jgi:hypothetical protein
MQHGAEVPRLGPLEKLLAIVPGWPAGLARDKTRSCQLAPRFVPAAVSIGSEGGGHLAAAHLAGKEACSRQPPASPS